MGVFEASDAFPGASAIVRRALGNMNLAAPELKRLVEAANAIHPGIQVPVWNEHCIAHAGWPDLKICINMAKEHASSAEISDKRDAWKAIGWTMLLIRKTYLRTLPHERLVRDLREAMECSRTK